MTQSNTLVKFHCDHCGHEELVEPHSQERGRWSVFVAESSDDLQRISRKHEGMDLCPMCMESLILWWAKDNPHITLKDPEDPAMGYLLHAPIVPDRKEVETET